MAKHKGPGYCPDPGTRMLKNKPGIEEYVTIQETALSDSSGCHITCPKGRKFFFQGFPLQKFPGLNPV